MYRTRIGLTLNVSTFALLFGAATTAHGQSTEAVGAAAPTSVQVAAGAAAAPAGAAQSGSPDDIIVTAQRRTQRLQDVPVAVSVVAGEALVQQNLTSLASISARLPAVNIVSGPLTDYLNIRGVGSGQNAGFEQSVGTFVDGLYRGRSKSSRAALFDVEQVEVLKGPQTTFFGNNAIAGALNVTTRKPGDLFEYNASASYGFEHGEYIVQGGVTVPLTPTLSARVAGQVSGQDGYIDNRNTGNDAPRERNLLGRAALRWEPSNSWRSDLRLDIGRQRSRDSLSAIVLNCPSPLAGPFDVACPLFLAANNGNAIGNKPYYTSYAQSNFLRYDFQEAELTNSIDLGGPTLNLISGYFHHNYRAIVQLIPTTVPGIGGGSQAPSPYNEKVRQLSQEIRLQSETGGTFEWMVGAYYANLHTDVVSRFGAYFLPFGAFNPLGNTSATTPIAAQNFQRYRDNSYSAFGSLTVRPIEHLRVNLGLRYTAVHKTAHRFESFGTTPDATFGSYSEFDPITSSVFAAILGSDLGDFPDPKRKDDRLLPSAGVQYDINANVMAYATFSQGFKAGGFSAANTIDIFGPEKVNAYEVGIKSQLLDRRLTLNVDLFRSDYSDLQETTITFNPLPVSGVANAAASRAQGVELNAAYRVSPNLRITTDVAYLDSKYRSYPNAVCTMAQTAATPVGCTQDLSGKRRPYSPKFSGNVGLDFSLPVGSNVVHFAPLVYFSTAYFTTATADPLLKQSGFAKLDARISYGPEDRRWEISVVGKNLTNKATASYRNPLTAGNGSVYALPDPSRIVAVQLSIKG